LIIFSSYSCQQIGFDLFFFFFWFCELSKESILYLSFLFIIIFFHMYLYVMVSEFMVLWIVCFDFFLCCQQIGSGLLSGSVSWARVYIIFEFYLFILFLAGVCTLWWVNLWCFRLFVWFWLFFCILLSTDGVGSVSWTRSLRYIWGFFLFFFAGICIVSDNVSNFNIYI